MEDIKNMKNPDIMSRMSKMLSPNMMAEMSATISEYPDEKYEIINFFAWLHIKNLNNPKVIPLVNHSLKMYLLQRSC